MPRLIEVQENRRRIQCSCGKTWSGNRKSVDRIFRLHLKLKKCKASKTIGMNVRTLKSSDPAKPKLVSMIEKQGNQDGVSKTSIARHNTKRIKAITRQEKDERKQERRKDYARRFFSNPEIVG